MGGEEATRGEAGSLYRFAHAEFDERAHELRVDGRAVAVEAKALSVLACLLGRPGETLTKDELFEAAWPGRVVTEGTLTKAVMKLRAVLGDERQAIIRTVHGFGYRLGVPVERLASDAPARFLPAPGQAVPFRPNWRLLESLDPDRRNMVWLAEHAKTRDRRVFKFADGADALVTLKREITLYRLLHDSLGAAAPVAHIFDWNLDEPPYFTESEWVEGGDLGQWLAASADESRDPVGAEAPPTSATRTPALALRLEAMAQACEAVAATHALGVVHKDLKPANVLVRPVAEGGIQVRLADFGIGALTDAAAIEALGITKLGFTRTRGDRDSSSGTPLYLAPEVIGGRVPTQKSDIYALGVMLYQAIVADPRRPLAPGWERDVDDELLREDIAAAADVDPEQRLGDAAELARRLRGLKERRAEREREHAAKAASQRLAQRLERARMQRRWAAAVVVVLLLGVIASIHLYLRAERERAVAVAVNRFLNEDLLARADPFLAPEPDMRVAEALEHAAENVGARFASQPRVEAALRHTLGRSFAALGLAERAQAELARALALVERNEGARSDHALDLRYELALVDFDLDRVDAADATLRTLHDEVVRRYGAGSMEQVTLRLNHAIGLSRVRRQEEALALLEPLMPALERHRSEAPAMLRTGLRLRGDILRQLGRRDEARADLFAALEGFPTDGPDPDLDAGWVLNALAQLERADGRHAEAETWIRRALSASERRLGRGHPTTQSHLNELAGILQDSGRLDEAVLLFRELLDLRETRLGDGHQLTRNSLNNLALTLVLRGELEEAEGYYRRVLAIERELLGPDHLDVLILSHNLAGLMRRQQKYADAIAMHMDTVARAEAMLGPEREEPGLFRVGLANTLSAAGRFGEAEAEYAAAESWLVRSLGPEHPRLQRLAEMREANRSRVAERD
jgi:DNA-binding winged helix-turn-helix (wHTH) protein/tetratricopeptide (TPR) repeat protein